MGAVSSWHSCDILTRMMLTCPEEIGCVGRGCYEDASNLYAGEQHNTRTNTAADCLPTNQVSTQQAELGSRPTSATS